MIAATLDRIRQLGAALFGRKPDQCPAPESAPLPPVTDWYPPEVDPAYVGFYQRKYGLATAGDSSPRSPDYWDGRNWHFGVGDGRYSSATCLYRLPWRGLTKLVDDMPTGEGK